MVECFVQQPNQNSNLHSEAASISGVIWLFKHPESCLILQLLWGVYLKLLAKTLYELTESLLRASFNSETIEKGVYGGIIRKILYLNLEI